MTDTTELVTNLVASLRDIPDIVQAMGSDKTRIYAYEDRYPKNCSLTMAKLQMPAPGIMVAYEGFSPASRGQFETIQHEISCSLRAVEASTDDTPSGYYRLGRLIYEGEPASKGIPMYSVEIDSSCDPMNVPSLRRQTDQQGVDYWELIVSFTEK